MVPILLLALTSATQTSSPQERALPLRELCQRADLVFTGRVAKIIQMTMEAASDALPAVDVIEIQFADLRWLKAPAPGGPTLTVVQLLCLLDPRSIRLGDRVLWFLGPEGWRGFRSPVGLRSGDFRVTIDPFRSYKSMALNRHYNAGLDESRIPEGEPVALDFLEETIRRILSLRD